MKRNILFLAIGMSIQFVLFAQGPIDALRYSQTFSGGTARATGMGGAFGALGGDFSSLSINPAGLGVYRSSEFTLTPEVHMKKTTSRYIGKEVEEPLTNFNMNNLGFVGHIKINETGLKSINLSIGYNKINNFNRTTVINGDNQETTLADAMAESANRRSAFEPNDLDEYSERLFWDGWLIDQDDQGYLASDFFFDNGNFLPGEQKKSIQERGKMNEWNISASFNISDVFYFGASFNIIPVTYEMTSSFKEYDVNERSFMLFDYMETVKVDGTGYSGKFGIIARPIPMLRIGASLHLPTSFRLKEEYFSSLNSNHDSAYSDTYYPYEDENHVLRSDYKIITPLKGVGSIAVTLGKVAIISTDIEYLNYSSMKMEDWKSNASEDGGYFGSFAAETYASTDYSPVNEEIKAIYKNAMNIKTGAEVRMGSFRVRGGFGFYGSPFQENDINSEAYTVSYSAGFGFRQKNFFFDLGWMLSYNDEQQYLYYLDNLPNNKANIDTKTNRLLATIGVRF